MPKALAVLNVEDSKSDSDLIARLLKKAGYDLTFKQVDNAAQMRAALKKQAWDVVIADYSLPQFDGHAALKLLQETGLDIPFIAVSGTIGEETAVGMMKAGAQDYLMKENLIRLVPAIERELEQAEVRRRQKQAEQALVESEKQYRLLFENAPVGVFQSTPEGRYLRVNSALANIFGYDSAEELIAGITDIASQVHVQPGRRREFMQRLADDGQVMDFVNRNYRRDGSQIWTSTNARAVKDMQGEVLYYEGFMTDITERKGAEEVLREKERLLSEAQHIGHIGSWHYDIDRDALQYSDEMYRLLDVSAGEFGHTLKAFLDLIYPDDRAAVENWMEEMMAGRQHKELGFRVFHKNYELYYIHGRGEVIYDTNGRPAGLIGTAQDVTERMLAEIQIRQQIEQLTALRKIDQAITSSLNLRSTLDTILSQAIAQLHVDAADVLLLSSDGRTLEYAAGQGFHMNGIEVTGVRVGDSHAGRAVKERRLINIENLKDQAGNLFLTPLPAGEEFVCYYGVPLIAKGTVKGVLEVFHRLPLQPYPEWIDFLNTLAGQMAIAIDNASLLENLKNSNLELVQAYDVTIEGWSRALDLRDRETEGHTRRVAEMAVKLAKVFGFGEPQLTHIRWGALLHDIGKMGVPDGILLKAGDLSEDELEVMQKHPAFAYELLSPIDYLKSAIDIPYCHHEKWDGTGYPRGLQGEQIPLPARIFAIVDVYDALISDRPYRPAWTKEKALEHIQGLSGTHFDPRVVKAFFEVFK